MYSGKFTIQGGWTGGTEMTGYVILSSLESLVI